MPFITTTDGPVTNVGTTTPYNSLPSGMTLSWNSSRAIITGTPSLLLQTDQNGTPDNYVTLFASNQYGTTNIQFDMYNKNGPPPSFDLADWNNSTSTDTRNPPHGKDWTRAYFRLAYNTDTILGRTNALSVTGATSIYLDNYGYNGTSNTTTLPTGLTWQNNSSYVRIIGSTLAGSIAQTSAITVRAVNQYYPWGGAWDTGAMTSGGTHGSSGWASNFVGPYRTFNITTNWCDCGNQFYDSAGSSGTFTTHSDVGEIRVWLVGGGGGGKNSLPSGGANWWGGGGGGAAGASQAWVVTVNPSTGYSWNVGAGGSQNGGSGGGSGAFGKSVGGGGGSGGQGGGTSGGARGGNGCRNQGDSSPAGSGSSVCMNSGFGNPGWAGLGAPASSCNSGLCGGCGSTGTGASSNSTSCYQINMSGSWCSSSALQSWTANGTSPKFTQAWGDNNGYSGINNGSCLAGAGGSGCNIFGWDGGGGQGGSNGASGGAGYGAGGGGGESASPGDQSQSGGAGCRGFVYIEWGDPTTGC